MDGKKNSHGKTWPESSTGSVSIEQLRIFERDKTEVFFSMQEFYLNLELWKAINKQYEIIEVTMKGPAVSIIQEGDSFNFDDLIAHFTRATLFPRSAEIRACEILGKKYYDKQEEQSGMPTRVLAMKLRSENSMPSAHLFPRTIPTCMPRWISESTKVVI